MSKFLLTGITCLILCINTSAQKVRIAVIGSSTAVGTGATDPKDSGWVGLTRIYFNSLHQLDTLVNLAAGGTATIDGMPGNGEATSVTAALAYNPDVVIVSYVSNDAAGGVHVDVTMSHLRAIYKAVIDAGKICWITTPHPRDDLAGQPGGDHQTFQFGVLDSTYLEFPQFNLDFWDCLVASNDTDIAPIYDAGDGVHLNNAGHQQLFNVVKAANILSPFFPLPLNFIDFNVTRQPKGDLLNWTVGGKGSCPSFEVQRSGNSIDFDPVAEKNTADDAGCTTYSWTDASPLAGKSYYRLKMLSDGATIYSQIVSVESASSQEFALSTLFIPEAGSRLSIDLQTNLNRKVVLSVINTSGVVVRRVEGQAFAPSSRFDLSLDGLSKGQYFVHIVSSDGKIVTKGFIFR